MKMKYSQTITMQEIVFIRRHHVRYIVLTFLRKKGLLFFVGINKEGREIFDIVINSGLPLAEQKLTLIHELLHIRKMLIGYWGQTEWAEKQTEGEAEEFSGLHPATTTWLFRGAECRQRYTYEPSQLL